MMATTTTTIILITAVATTISTTLTLIQMIVCPNEAEVETESTTDTCDLQTGGTRCDRTGLFGFFLFFFFFFSFLYIRGRLFENITRRTERVSGFRDNVIKIISA